MRNYELAAMFALQGVKEEIFTIEEELKRKGFKEPKGFSVLKQYVDDRINDLNKKKGDRECLNEQKMR